jgi:N-methylhydantoinase A/oxoprolinase/acetone carboxylase beta subunit
MEPEHGTVSIGGRRRRVPIYDRLSLAPGKKHTGPAVIAEYSATTIVPPGADFSLDKAGNLIVEIA